MTDGSNLINEFKESTARALEYASGLELEQKREFLQLLDKSLIELAEFADKLELDVNGDSNDG